MASHRKGPAARIGGTMIKLAAKASLQTVYSNKIQTPCELFNYSSNNVHYILVCPRRTNLLNYMKKPADQFDTAVAISGTQVYHCFKPLNSRTITTTVTSLYTSITTHQVTKNLKSNSTDRLVSHLIMTSKYDACRYYGHW
jgi:hypothetical protein